MSTSTKYFLFWNQHFKNLKATKISVSRRAPSALKAKIWDAGDFFVLFFYWFLHQADMSVHDNLF